MSEWFELYGFADVDDGLIVGAVPTDHGDVERISGLGVTRVLNLVEDGEYHAGARDDVELGYELHGVQEVRFSTLDYGGLSAELLEQASEQILSWLEDGQTVYLHCRAGWQRSATVAGAVVSRRHDVSPKQALGMIGLRKPTADPLPHQRDDLQSWWETRRPD